MHYTQNPPPEKSKRVFWVICFANIYKKSQTTKKKLSNKVISALIPFQGLFLLTARQSV